MILSLNTKIDIEKGTNTESSVMSPEITYEPYMTTWANAYVRSISTQFNESTDLLYTTEFTIRYNSKSKLINNKYRVKYNNMYYSIIEIIEVERKHALKLICQHWYGE